MHNKTDTVKAVILGPLVFSFAFALDVYVPAVPHLVEVFHTTPDKLQLTLSLFVFFFGFGQLVMGPICDQLGRVPVLRIGAVLFILGSLICAFSTHIGLLIVGRVTEAIGACALMVTAFAIVRDVSAGNSSARIYSLLNASISMSPMFAPLIGGYLDKWFGWQSIFYFLAILGSLALVLDRCCIVETLSKDKRIVFDWGILKRYYRIFVNADFFYYTLISAVAIAVFFSFFSLSPYILIKLLSVSEEHFGYYFGAVGTTFFIGSIIASRLLEKWGKDKTILLGVMMMLAGGLLLIVWYHINGLSRLGMMIPSTLAITGGSFMVGAGAGGAMEPFSEQAGSAAALYGCCEFMFASLVGSFVVSGKITSYLPLAHAILVMNSVLLIVLCIRKKRCR